MICTRTLSSMDMPLPLDISAGTSVTIGNFDGVHLGHQALLALTRNRAEAAGTLPIAITFDPHPLEVLTPHAPPRLTTTQSRLALLDASGMALVILIAFTPEVAAMAPETFVRRVLLDNLNMRELFLGYDFTLGKGRAGTPEVLAELGKVRALPLSASTRSALMEMWSAPPASGICSGREMSGKPAPCSGASTAFAERLSTGRIAEAASSVFPPPIWLP